MSGGYWLAGTALFVVLLLRPFAGPALLPLLVPFLAWLPDSGVRGVNALHLTLGGALAGWTVQRVMRRQPVLRAGRLVLPLVLLIAVCGLAWLRGAALPPNPGYHAAAAGLDAFRAVVSLTVYFVTFAIARGARERRIVAFAILAGLAAESAVTIVLGANGPGGRALGSIGHPNELGAFLAVGTVAAAALFTGVRGPFARLALVALVAAGGWAIFLTLSRGALVALAAGLVVVAAHGSRRIAVLVLVVFAAAPWWLPQAVKDRIAHTGEPRPGSSGLDHASQLRIDTWRAIGKIAGRHPFDGVGFSGLAAVLPETGAELGAEVAGTAHNSFLRVLGEAGILGALVLVWVMVRSGWLAREAARVARTAFDRQLGVALAGSLAALVVACCFSDWIFDVRVTAGFWMIAALADDVVHESPAEAR